jgi:serine/threonine-protein kinase
MSRRCPRCKTVYAGEARFCPKDGSPLVDVGEVGGTPIATPSGKPDASGKTEVRKVTVPRADIRMSGAGALVGQVLEGRYRVLRKLGEGGMSYVYEAQDVTTTQSVAIKVLIPRLGRDQSSVERLRREAGLAMRLEHRNVCRIMRFGETEGGLIYLVMPYLHGELLADREQRLGPISPDVGLDYLVQTCAGLHHAHQMNIIHRDLKPENIMLIPSDDGRERAVIMDFGLAKESKADPVLAKLTATGIILGTPEFMSPEQIRGRELDARSDVYALGIVAFEMFTGRLPFEGRTPQEMMLSRLRGKPTPLRKVRPELPAQLEAALMKALESEPKDRYPSARDFGLALAGCANGEERIRLERLLA